MATALRNLPKHDRYKDLYQPSELYWGLGVEHETYIMTNQTRTIRTFDGVMKPERYSVNYYAAYKPEPLRQALTAVLTEVSGALVIPILMNSHSMTHADLYGEHQTTYERQPKPNPRFNGKLFFDWICSHSDWLRTEYEKSYMWDGDTVEFMTQNFYKTTVPEVMRELSRAEECFVTALQELPRQGLVAVYGPLSLASPRNEPWASHITNVRNVAMFNNGTLHVNITLPTHLNADCEPADPVGFLEGHRRLARLIQWMEPLWVALYGSGDPLAAVSDQFAAGSQRVAVSRYIGLGTYDTDTMPTGKILQIPKATAGPLPWYEWLHGRTAYQPLDVIGLDINYNKHWSHGLEIRMFDQMAMDDLRAVLTHLVLLGDVAMQTTEIPNPRHDIRWQQMAGVALYEGPNWRVEPSHMIALCAALRIPCDQKEPLNVFDAIQYVVKGLRRIQGPCWAAMMEGRQPILETPVHQEHHLQHQHQHQHQHYHHHQEQSMEHPTVQCKKIPGCCTVQ